MKILYICDGEACQEKKGRPGTTCYKYCKRDDWSKCYHTTDINHALSFVKSKNGNLWERLEIEENGEKIIIPYSEMTDDGEN